MRSMIVLGGSLAVLGVASPARAQTAASCVSPQPADASREQLIHAAVDCAEARDHAAALALAQAAGQIAMSPSLRMLIAEEQEQTGALAAALASAALCERDAADAPLAPGASSHLAEVRDHCHAVAARVDARVGRIVVRLPTPAPDGLVVRVAGEAIADPHDGTAVVVAPGVVSVEARADGRAPWRTEVRVAAGEAVDTTPVLRSLRVRAAPVVARVEAPRFDAGPWVVLGASAVMLLASGSFALFRAGVAPRCSDTTTLPGSTGCLTQSDLDWFTAWTVSTDTALVAGGALAAAGVTWLLVDVVARGHRPRPLRAMVTPLAGGGAWLGLGAGL